MASGGTNNENEGFAVFSLESNVLQRGFLYSFARRNVAEALVISGSICYAIMTINFTLFVKAVYLLVFGLGTFVLIARGYKNRSFLQAAHDYVHTLKTRKQLHLRGPEYVRQDIKIQEGENADKSIAERIYENARIRLDRFVEQYGGEEEAGEGDT